MFQCGWVKNFNETCYVKIEIHEQKILVYFSVNKGPFVCLDSTICQYGGQHEWQKTLHQGWSGDGL